MAGASPDAPLFINISGNILTRRYFVDSIKNVIANLGLPSDKYSGHSFRSGAATTAAKSNVPDHLIQTMGRWSSNCYQRYIHTDKRVLLQAQLRMCK